MNCKGGSKTNVAHMGARQMLVEGGSRDCVKTILKTPEPEVEGDGERNTADQYTIPHVAILKWSRSSLSDSYRIDNTDMTCATLSACSQCGLQTWRLCRSASTNCTPIPGHWLFPLENLCPPTDQTKATDQRLVLMGSRECPHGALTNYVEPGWLSR